MEDILRTMTKHKKIHTNDNLEALMALHANTVETPTNSRKILNYFVHVETITVKNVTSCRNHDEHCSGHCLATDTKIVLNASSYFILLFFIFS